jgi:hypothetical protein
MTQRTPARKRTVTDDEIENARLLKAPKKSRPAPTMVDFYYEARDAYVKKRNRRNKKGSPLAVVRRLDYTDCGPAASSSPSSA